MPAMSRHAAATRERGDMSKPRVPLGQTESACDNRSHDTESLTMKPRGLSFTADSVLALKVSSREAAEGAKEKP